VCRGIKGTAVTVELTFFTPQDVTMRDLRFLYNGVDTDSSLSGSIAAWTGTNVPTFRRSIVPPPSGYWTT